MKAWRGVLGRQCIFGDQLQEMIPSPTRNGISARAWRRDITDDDKLSVSAGAGHCPATKKRPASGQAPGRIGSGLALKAPVWAEVNRHYAHLGVNVKSADELVEQLGILRYGHRPRV